jgi:hypothetical protein
LASCSTFGEASDGADAGAEAAAEDASADRTDALTDPRCPVVQNRGTAVPIRIAAEDPPAPLGGDINAGTYTLTEYVRYVGPAGPPGTDGLDLHTATLVIEDSKYAFIENRSRLNVAAKDERAGDLVHAGTSMTWKEVCSTVWGNENFSYSSNPNTVVLYRTGAIGDPGLGGYPMALVFKKM